MTQKRREFPPFLPP